MGKPLDADGLDTLFLEARSYNDWTPAPFGEADVRAIYALMKWGPTAGNSSPARFYWALTKKGKDRIVPHLWEPNRAKTYKASATVIVAHDYSYPDTLAKLLPVVPEEEARGFFAAPGVLERSGFRNTAMQGAYLMLAARALGWEVGPMSGFEHDPLDAEFFSGTKIASNFIVNIGRGTQTNLNPRLPRLSFEEANVVF